MRLPVSIVWAFFGTFEHRHKMVTCIISACYLSQSVGGNQTGDIHVTESNTLADYLE